MPSCCDFHSNFHSFDLGVGSRWFYMSFITWVEILCDLTHAASWYDIFDL